MGQLHPATGNPLSLETPKRICCLCYLPGGVGVVCVPQRQVLHFSLLLCSNACCQGISDVGKWANRWISRIDVLLIPFHQTSAQREGHGTATLDRVEELKWQCLIHVQNFLSRGLQLRDMLEGLASPLIFSFQKARNWVFFLCDEEFVMALQTIPAIDTWSRKLSIKVVCETRIDNCFEKAVFFFLRRKSIFYRKIKFICHQKRHHFFPTLCWALGRWPKFNPRGALCEGKQQDWCERRSSLSAGCCSSLRPRGEEPQ